MEIKIYFDKTTIENQIHIYKTISDTIKIQAKNNNIIARIEMTINDTQLIIDNNRIKSILEKYEKPKKKK